MNSFGVLYRVSLYGESHGPGVGVVVDGTPAGLSLPPGDFLLDIERRKSGKKGTTTRLERDEPEILSGVFEGKTTGSPIHLFFRNENTRSQDYSQVLDVPRPGHADFVAQEKFHGFQDYRGGGHFSGRLTLPLVAAGTIAKKITAGIRFSAEILEVGGSKEIDKTIAKAIEMGDSVGGLVQCTIANLPIGLGEPFFYSVESALSQILFSIPAVRALEFGSGFEAARMRGSEHNDAFISSEGKTGTNHHAGILGGITTGNDIVFRLAIKPTPSIAKTQRTINRKTGEMVDLTIPGRHDVCIALRVPPIVEAAAAIVMADLLLLDRTRQEKGKA